MIGKPIFFSYLFDCAKCKETKEWIEPNPIRIFQGYYKDKLLCISCAEVSEQEYYRELAMQARVQKAQPIGE